MKEITHRQLRNDSAAVLRRVEAGETILVLNGGRPAAVIGPSTGDTVSTLAARGQLRAATAPPHTLKDIRRITATHSTAEIIEDSRGHW